MLRVRPARARDPIPVIKQRCGTTTELFDGPTLLEFIDTKKI
jgi:hypothetical protein